MKRLYAQGNLLLIIFASLHFTSSAQPDYSFQGGVLISGTDKQIGAVYKYTNVRPGVDATVTIADITTGITVADMDAGSGYNEALQPTLNSDPFTNGYLEMKFSLLVAGTNSPYTAAEVPVTCIDIDGTIDNDGNGNPLYEFDEVDLGPGSYVDFATFGGELIVSTPGDWANGKNVGGVDYPGRDTSAKVVMYTVVNTNISNFTIRVGVDNQSSQSSQRLRSVYFKKFTYPHYPLPLPKILDFSGNRSGKDIVLNWKMESGGEWEQCILERSPANEKFEAIAVFLSTEGARTDYKYTDNHPSGAGNYFYRLKLIGIHGEIKYSYTLVFKTDNRAEPNKMLVYPTLVQDRFTVRFRSESNEMASLQIIDYSGKAVYNRQIQLRQGENNISVAEFSAARGNYIVVIYLAGRMYNQKIVFQ